jgi:isoquinoline 1-oxidoreductase beta subunit
MQSGSWCRITRSSTVHHSRRQFVKLAVTASGGLIFRFGCAEAGVKAEREGRSFTPDIHVRIDPDNTVTLGLAKQEMGQGVETGLPMILADELGADWQTLKVEPIVFDSALPGFRERFGLMETGGSTSTQEGWNVLRQAGAGARETLILASASQWNFKHPLPRLFIAKHLRDGPALFRSRIKVFAAA